MWGTIIFSLVIDVCDLFLHLTLLVYENFSLLEATFNFLNNINNTTHASSFSMNYDLNQADDFENPCQDFAKNINEIEKTRYRLNYHNWVKRNKN